MKMIIKIIFLFVMFGLYKIVGNETDWEFICGIAWCLLAIVTLVDKITIIKIDEDGNETRKRIY